MSRELFVVKDDAGQVTAGGLVVPSRGPLVPPDYTPTPADIGVRKKSFQKFWNGFENSETETSAFWLVEMATERGSWAPFTFEDVQAIYGKKFSHKFTFNHLIEPGIGYGLPGERWRTGGGWIVKQGETYFFTEEFVQRCYLSANKHDELEARYSWKREQRPMETDAPRVLDPYKTMCVLRKDGKEVGRIAACAEKAPLYIDEMARLHGGLEIDYEFCEHASTLAFVHGGGPRLLPNLK